MNSPNDKSSPMVIYIAGYGRSGSTILQTILGSSKNIRAGGEMSFIPNALEENESCACGKLISECPFWHSIEKARLDDWQSTDRLMQSIESFSFWKVIRFLFGDPWYSSAPIEDYAKVSCAEFQVLARGNVDAVVDSSKTAWRACFRPLALNKISGMQVKVIHLRRSIRGVLASVSKGTNRALEGAGREKWFRHVRGLIGWIFSNWVAEKLEARLGEESVYTLNFEDFLHDPVSQIVNIQQFLGIGLEDIVSIIETNGRFPVGHTVGGNRMRYEKAVLLRSRQE